MKWRWAARVSRESWETAPFCQWRKRPSFLTLIAAKYTIFLIPFPSFFPGGERWAALSNPYPRLVYDKAYLEMAMVGPRPRKILANPRTSCRRRKRPAFRNIIAAKNALFLTPLSSCFQGG